MHLSRYRRPHFHAPPPSRDWRDTIIVVAVLATVYAGIEWQRYNTRKTSCQRDQDNALVVLLQPVCTDPTTRADGKFVKCLTAAKIARMSVSDCAYDRWYETLWVFWCVEAVSSISYVGVAAIVVVIVFFVNQLVNACILDRHYARQTEAVRSAIMQQRPTLSNRSFPRVEVLPDDYDGNALDDGWQSDSTAIRPRVVPFYSS